MFLEVTRILGEGTRIGESPGINTSTAEALLKVRDILSVVVGVTVDFSVS